MKTIILSFFTLILFSMSTVQAQNDEVFTGDNGVAIKGYDVVSYHTAHKAVKGSSEYSVKHDGATYHFSSAENKNMFKKDPEKYLPAYGGYCAFAMGAKNAKVPSNPDTFKFYNGELLLFFNDLYEGQKFNTIVPWNQSEADMKAKADANWNAMN